VADEEHLWQIRQGVDTWNKWLWNQWRQNSPQLQPDLQNADLRRANLRAVDLRRSKLAGANLKEAVLIRAQLSGTDLTGANLMRANLRSAAMNGANLTSTILYETVFASVNLSGVVGLEACKHRGPSIIDHRTFQKSGPLPLSFLRGIGLPDNMADYLPALFNQAIRYYSCFISYSTKDQKFADRIYGDLQAKGIRCWFAPHDLPGGKILDEIDSAIRLRDKVLLILSEHSINSDWVEDEVKTAFEEERNRGQTVLFPIRLDDVVMTTNEAWAAKLRAGRNIGDFRRWKHHDAYQQSFERALRDLTLSPAAP
jgi:hypothetical protein